ncbi:hypothetical protein BM525_20990 (plasmid) [Alteromonas mediterranea]|uniref:Carrier domain-containing protein n=1 Tax=Alteromonas mediterranea TaxID=314275 RepID=A0AAC9JI65_9ALTE|nr:hypothetical protein [Alteromonas mediterranea]APD92338.1 hypothetical protein BM524_20765 [Alteromonas mediterranea]APE00199.1 hypothetical protein BM525_20990 [Alteromonas mediterranea]
MFISKETICVQAVWSVLEETFGCDCEGLFVDLPLVEMLRISPIDMVKFTLALEVSLGFQLDLTGLTNCSSINEVAQAVLRSEYQALSAA